MILQEFHHFLLTIFSGSGNKSRSETSCKREPEGPHFRVQKGFEHAEHSILLRYHDGYRRPRGGSIADSLVDDRVHGNACHSFHWQSAFKPNETRPGTGKEQARRHARLE
jgi:hypothetical protein